MNVLSSVLVEEQVCLEGLWDFMCSDISALKKCIPLCEELEIQLGPTLSGNSGGEQNSHSLKYKVHRGSKNEDI